MTHKPTPSSAECPECKQSLALTLAVDGTIYMPVLSIKPFVTQSAPHRFEPMDDQPNQLPAVRMYCANCMAYFAPPKDGIDEVVRDLERITP